MDGGQLIYPGKLESNPGLGFMAAREALRRARQDKTQRHGTLRWLRI
jgi:hypothetical protein